MSGARSLASRRAGALDFLRRRVAYLTKRIEQAGPGARSFDIAERAAVEIAIADAARCEEVVKVLTGPGTDAEKLAAIRSTLCVQERAVSHSERPNLDATIHNAAWAAPRRKPVI